MVSKAESETVERRTGKVRRPETDVLPLCHATNYSEVRLTFDRYIASSLKGQTRDKRTGSVVTRFKISENTLIENVSLKTLLSHVETKKELTAYLSQKFVKACEQLS